LKPSIRGIWPVLVMPFLDNGEIDEFSLRKEIDYVIERRADGVVIFGLASEIYKFSDQERRRVIEVVVRHTEGRVPVIAGTEHSGTEKAAERSYEAQELGVSAVMVYPPSFVKPDRDNIIEYYGQIADRVNIPVMIQDAQSWTQVPLPVDLLLEINRMFPVVNHVKIETLPTGPKISRVLEASAGQIGVMAGYGGLHYFEEMLRGAEGTLIPPAICEWFVEMDRSYRAGNANEAFQLYSRYLPFLLFEMGSLDMLMEIQKILFQKAGIFKTAVMRKPHTPMDNIQYGQLHELAKRFGLQI